MAAWFGMQITAAARLPERLSVLFSDRTLFNACSPVQAQLETHSGKIESCSDKDRCSISNPAHVAGLAAASALQSTQQLDEALQWRLSMKSAFPTASFAGKSPSSSVTVNRTCCSTTPVRSITFGRSACVSRGLEGSAKHIQLMPQPGDLGFQLRLCPKRRSQVVEQP